MEQLVWTAVVGFFQGCSKAKEKKKHGTKARSSSCGKTSEKEITIDIYTKWQINMREMKQRT